MGRTIPSYRIASVEERKEWKGFHQALDKSDKKTFDHMFDIAHLYNSASSYSARPIRIHPIFMSIIFRLALKFRHFEESNIENIVNI